MEFQGAIKFIGDIENIKGKFKKRTIVLVDGRYSNKGIVIDFLGNKINLTENLEKGYIVNIEFNVKCHESKENKGKFFNSFYGTSCEIIDKFTVCSDNKKPSNEDGYFLNDGDDEDEKGARYYDIDLGIDRYITFLDEESFDKEYSNKPFEDPNRFRPI